jgi:hypothetical protein
VMSQEVVRFQPDLVLCLGSLGDDITQERPAPGVFDWRGLRLVQLAQMSLSEGRWATADTRGTSAPPTTDPAMAYLQSGAVRLNVCRAPISPAMDARWNQKLAYFDDVVQSCRRHDLPLALVLVPGEFQVDQVLLSTLARRVGCAGEQLDLDMPQRRLAVFAEQRDVPLLDLLPRLRSSPQPAFRHNARGLSPSGSEIAADAMIRWLTDQFGSQVLPATRPDTLVAEAPATLRR